MLHALGFKQVTVIFAGSGPDPDGRVPAPPSLITAQTTLPLEASGV